MSERTYVCPECNYAGFKLTKLTGTIDFSIQFACPACATVRGLTVWLRETSDPRDAA